MTELTTNLVVGQRWRHGHVAVHSCPVPWGTVGTVEETCDWALTVTSRLLWTTTSRPWCRPFPLHWELLWSKDERQVLRTWRPMSPAGTRNALVWCSYVMTGRCSLEMTSFKRGNVMNKRQIHKRNTAKLKIIINHGSIVCIWPLDV